MFRLGLEPKNHFFVLPLLVSHVQRFFDKVLPVKVSNAACCDVCCKPVIAYVLGRNSEISGYAMFHLRPHAVIGTCVH